MADVLVIGDGVIGLSTAFELTRAGAECTVIGERQPGVASLAAAGLLAPSIGHHPEAVHPFYFGSLDLYPGFVERLRAADPELRLVPGLLDVGPRDPDRPVDAMPRLSPGQVRELEPSVAAPDGGSYYATNAAVDNVALVGALREAVRSSKLAEYVVDDGAIAIDLAPAQPAVTLKSGSRRSAATVVIAAGAWSPQIAGLPRKLPVTPLKGQMLALGAAVLTRSVMSPDVYLVPRRTETVVGATVEEAGFDLTVEPDAIERLRAAAVKLCPALESAPVIRSWAGTRPATPDFRPIIGRDPADPRVIYACGHSKNGILLAPVTAVVVAALAQGRAPGFDLGAFGVERW